MKLTLRWLKKHINMEHNLQIIEVVEALSNLSIEVDSLTKLGGEGYYVAEIINIEPHPNGDKLRLCTVQFKKQDQSTTKTIVCGAGNVRIGLKTIFAELNTVLPNGLTLGAKKIRGVVSEGMLLSYEEFGLNHIKKEGIIDESKAILDELVNEDYLINISLPANRIDLSSVRGLAEELAGYFKYSMCNLYKSEEGESRRNKSHYQIEIENPDFCSLFSTMAINNIKMKNNYNEVFALLLKVQNPTNIEIVNVANFITLDMGVPLHIYDKDKITGLKLGLMDREVDFVTLHGNIQLKPNYLVLKDIMTNEPLVLAGIIGGQHSACTFETKNILIEAALFNKKYFIQGYRDTNIQTTSTYYFNRGINITHYLLALEYFREFVHGEFSYAQIINNNSISLEPKELFLSYKDFYQLTGIGISLDSIINILIPYGYKCRIVNQETEGLNQEMGIMALVPISRSHVGTARDLIEEIFRLGSAVGLIKPLYKDINLKIKEKITSPMNQLFTIQDLLVFNGYKEVISFSFTDANNSDSIYIPNAIGAHKYLRSNITGSLKEYIDHIIENKLNMEYNGNLFEISKVFYRAGEIIKEHYNLGIAILFNQNRYGTISIEQQGVNILEKLGNLLYGTKMEITGEKIVTGKNLIGEVYYNKEKNYMILEIMNFNALRSPVVSEAKVEMPYMGSFTCRDYSCLMSEEQFTNIYYKELKKYSDIRYSLFDQYSSKGDVKEAAYGIRIKYLMEDISNREKDILNIFAKYQITLR